MSYNLSLALLQCLGVVDGRDILIDSYPQPRPPVAPLVYTKLVFQLRPAAGASTPTAAL